MKSPDPRDLRSIRRLNRRVHDPIAAWLGASLAFVARGLARPAPPKRLAERRDLHGSSASDSDTTRSR